MQAYDNPVFVEDMVRNVAARLKKDDRVQWFRVHAVNHESIHNHGAFAKVSTQARNLMAKGQHTRVRIKFRGKQVAELPIAVVAAAEVASFWWFGPLRVVLGHVVGKAVLDVEFVSNADQNVQAGRAALADGDLDKVLAEFEKALTMDRRHSGALLGKGIALKLRGDKAGARKCFEQAEEADPRGEAGREARRHLDNL